VSAIAVRSLGAGSDKGETGQHLPPRLYRLHVVFVFVSSLSCLRLSFVSPSVVEGCLVYVST
jgi:hypothetical protein